MKIIRPIAHEAGLLKLRLEEVEQELSNLKRENALLRQENTHLKGRVSRQPKSSPSPSTLHTHHLTPTSVVSPSTSTRTEVSTTSTRPRPSYAAPTKASKARTTAKDYPIVAQPTKKDIIIQPGFNNSNDPWAITCAPLTPRWISSYYKYRDGSLVKRTGNFMRATEASCAKEKPGKGSGWADDIVICRSEEKSSREKNVSDKAARRKECEATSGLLHGLDLQFLQSMSEQALHDLYTLRRLPVKTRLADNDWLDTSLETVRVATETQYSILHRGHDIAKQCVWDFFHTHKPRICARLLREGWPEVRFGWAELAGTFGEHRSSTDRAIFGFRQNCPYTVRTYLFSITHLRNAACHFSSCEPRFIDTCLQTVQKLAIQLYDEKRAFAVRDLRDELRKAVEDTVEEVQALEPFCLLPYADHCWGGHHKNMFDYARIVLKVDRHGARCYNLPRLPEPIMRVAAIWNQYVRECTTMRSLEELAAAEEGTLDEPEDQQARSIKRRYSTVASYCQPEASRDICVGGRRRRTVSMAL